MSKPMLFFLAAVYGSSWFVGPINLLAAVLALAEGRNPLGFVPLILLPFGLIIFVHHRAGWFPFGRRA